MILPTAILEVALRSCEVYSGTATGGGATTLIDTNQVSTANDFYNGGTMVFLSGTGLIGTTRVITDYDNTTKTFTFATGTAIAAGVKYAAIRANLTRQDLVNAINAALADMGNITQHDDTTVVTADTEEYDLPAGVANVVQVQVSASATEPFNWKTYYQWIENNGQLIFMPDAEPTTEDMLIRIYYNQPHADVSLDADEISVDIQPVRLYWAAAAHALAMRMRNARNEQPSLTEAWKYAVQKSQEMAARYPIRTKARTPIYSALGR